MKSNSRLRLECLEDRSTPAVFGTPWLDGMHLTLSFAPDGADISGAASNLDQVLSELGTTDAKLAILQAFQTWAAYANLNLGLVADNGDSFSTVGAVQSDDRFGDIRIGARSLGSDVLAITAPFNLFDSFSGDVVINSDQPFTATGQSNAYDLFTALLQEAGHAFGVGNSADQTSVMYEDYLGARSGLSAADIASIQSLYGVRNADPFEGSSGNDSMTTATSYSSILEADISNSTDVDYYRFQVPAGSHGTAVYLRAAGLSLLTARIEILDSAGNVVASASSTDPTANDLDVFEQLHWGTYYVRVSGARNDAFGIGSYRLKINSDTPAIGTGNVFQLLSDEQGFNDEFNAATELTADSAVAGLPVDYRVRSTILTGDVDWYKVHSPSSNDAVNLIASAWSLDSQGVQPRVEVFDNAGNSVAMQVITNDGRSSVLQASNLSPDRDYYIRVDSESGATGNYELALDFRGDSVVFDHGAAGQLSSQMLSTSGVLVVNQSQVMHVVFTASTDSQTDAQVELTIVDNQGQLVARMIVNANESHSADVFLATGSYTVTITLIGNEQPETTSINFGLDLAGITDPIGVTPSDTTGSSDGGSGSNSGSGPPPSDSGSGALTGSDPGDGSYWF